MIARLPNQSANTDAHGCAPEERCSSSSSSSSSSTRDRNGVARSPTPQQRSGARLSEHLRAWPVVFQPPSKMEMTFSSSSLASKPARDHRRRALHMSYQEEKGTVLKGTHDQMRSSCLCSSNCSPSR
ncbi:hypothetical protein QQF64_005514 [Cirrhinus molitorella]|uniref:Uncharacterized protein n=1 Tax=Cirrhinus molitorella TaxID=172907 RepID=A0ABR3MCF4_9TELE